MNQVRAHNVGLVFGGLLAIWHAIWATMVLVGMAKPFLDWIFGLHFLDFQYGINPFSLSNALMLVVGTGVIGYIFGYILGWLWNLVHSKAHAL